MDVPDARIARINDFFAMSKNNTSDIESCIAIENAIMNDEKVLSQLKVMQIKGYPGSTDPDHKVKGNMSVALVCSNNNIRLHFSIAEGTIDFEATEEFKKSKVKRSKSISSNTSDVSINEQVDAKKMSIKYSKTSEVFSQDYSLPIDSVIDAIVYRQANSSLVVQSGKSYHHISIFYQILSQIFYDTCYHLLYHSQTVLLNNLQELKILGTI